jgi:hypothetical protein
VATATATEAPDANSQASAASGPATRRFDIPSGQKGIIVWGNTEDLYGIARSPDGVTWVGNWTKGVSPEGGMLLRYGPDGAAFPPLVAPGGERGGWDGGYVHDLEGYGQNLFGLIGGELYRLDWNGQVLDHQDLDGLMLQRAQGDPTPAMLFGGNGEVLLAQKWSGELSEVVQGAGGKAAGRPLDGYPAKDPSGVATAFYRTRVTDGKGVVELGSKVIAEIAGGAPLTDLHIFDVQSDGRIYAMAESTGGSPPAPYQTVLRFGPAGDLLDKGVLPIPGRFMGVVRRTAVDVNGEVYALVGDQWKGFAVERVDFYPAAAELPTIAVPTYTPTPAIPTATPTPYKLQDVIEQAAKIAEVEVATSFPGSKVLRVKRYFKWFGITSQIAEKAQLEHNAYLRLVGPDSDLELLVPGRTYIVFLVHAGHASCPAETMGYDPWSPYVLLSGAAGAYEIRDGRIRNLIPAENTGYFDGPLDEFLNDLRSRVVDPTLSLTPVVDNGPVELVRIAHAADAIADVSIESAEAATGFLFQTLTVNRWLQAPATVGDGTIHIGTGRCQSNPSHSDANRYIVFISKGGDTQPGFTIYDSPFVTGGNNGIFSISKDGIVMDAGLGHYMGWRVEDLEAEIQRALNVPGTPDANVQPSP